MNFADDDVPHDPAFSEDESEGQVGPEELNCAGAYDAERTAGGVLLAARVVRMPHEWRLDEAIAAPLTLEWHDPVIRWMLSEQVGDEDDHRSYLMRQSVLVWSIFTSAPWSESTRKGVAFGLLLVGLESHGFRPRTDGHAAVRQILSPPADLFEILGSRGGIKALHVLLAAGFEFTGQPR